MMINRPIHVDLGLAKNPNAKTGKTVVMEYFLTIKPAQICDGGGWYVEDSENDDHIIHFKMLHKSVWQTRSLPLTSTSGDELVAMAVRLSKERFCKKS